jgi:hypothetical protein
MTDKQKRGAGRQKLGLRPGEKAAHKLGILDDVIATLQRAHDECVASYKAGSNASYTCSIDLFGHQASYLLRSLKAVRANAGDPFGVEAAFRVNCGPSVAEQAVLAREVKAEIEAGRATTAAEALENVSIRHHISFEKLKAIYYDIKDFI